MKIPHLKFVQTLLANRLDPVDVKMHLDKFGLPFPADSIKDIYEPVRKTDWKYFAKRSGLDIKLLKKLKIEPMYGYYFDVQVTVSTTDIDKAFELLDDPQKSQALFALAIAKVSKEDSELIINEKFRGEYSSQAIDYFYEYFFDLSDFTFEDRKRLERSFAKGTESIRMFRYAMTGDKNYLLWKIGVAPEKSMDQMMREMMTDSFYLFKEKTKNDADMAIKFGSLAVKLSDKLDKIMSADVKSDEVFQSFIFETDSDDKVKDAPTNGDLGETLDDPAADITQKAGDKGNYPTVQDLN